VCGEAANDVDEELAGRLGADGVEALRSGLTILAELGWQSGHQD
jgi:hypothetical protein